MSPGLLVPPWFAKGVPRQADVILSTFLWGFTMSLAVFAGSKGSKQTYRSWIRSHRVNAYIVMVWLEWIAGVILAAICWLYIMDWIPPSLWFFLGILVLWTIEMQCLTQIMANRISLVLYDPEKARRLKLGVALIIGIVNVSVFIVWIPARLQISENWITVNNIWDRIEKTIFLIVDLILNAYFMWLVKIKLIANGLTQYQLVYRFNMAMVCLSISIDIAIIGIMSLPDDTVYIQAHALGYIMKLYIEMNLAELIGKVIKRSNEQRCLIPDIAVGGWAANPSDRADRKKWREMIKRSLKPMVCQVHGINAFPLNRSVYGGKWLLRWPLKVHCRMGSASSSVEPLKSAGWHYGHACEGGCIC